jgi:Ribbon-helix-helix protein, copG family
MNQPIIVRGHALETIGSLGQPEPFSAVRLPTDLTAEIDAWANDHAISRSEAIRRLVELGLKVRK